MTITQVARYEVYDAIDTERAYQDRKWGNQADNPPPIDSFATYVAAFTNKLLATCSTSNSSTERLDAFRKVAALCVACMEHHGAPRRVLGD
jgi:hypothetical protein